MFDAVVKNADAVTVMCLVAEMVHFGFRKKCGKPDFFVISPGERGDAIEHFEVAHKTIGTEENQVVLALFRITPALEKIEKKGTGGKRRLKSA